MVPAARTNDGNENSTNRQILGSSDRFGAPTVITGDPRCPDVDAISCERDLSE